MFLPLTDSSFHQTDLSSEDFKKCSNFVGWSSSTPQVKYKAADKSDDQSMAGYKIRTTNGSMAVKKEDSY